MRLCRILRSPDSEAEGGQPSSEFVTISRAELDELRAKAAEGLASRPEHNDPRTSRSEFDESREAVLSRELAVVEQKSAGLERAYQAALRDRELATALIGKSLVPGAASQLIKLWRDDFEVIDEDGEIRIMARDGRSVNQVVDDRLTGPDFAHFCLPSSRGGTGSKGQNRSTAPGPKPTAPKNLGEAILSQWREAASRPQPSLTSSGWGRRR
jgi:hypothetical protein